jgi:hypothetical protein
MFYSTPSLSAEVLLNFYKGPALRDRSYPVYEEEAHDVDSSKYQEGTGDLQTVFNVQICLGGSEQEDVTHGR